MNKRILFVDDEPGTLEELQQMLKPLNHEWDVQTSLGGEKGFQKLEADHFDVVVSDMRVMRKDGSTLLAAAQVHFPEVVRIVLSSQTELSAALLAVPVAHQFITKPCELDQLRNTIRRACSLHTILTNKDLAEGIGMIDSLPSVPTTYAELTRVMDDPDVTVDAVAAIIQKDMGMMAKVLQLVNSAFFGIPRRLTNVHDAVGYLGMNVIKNLVFSIAAFKVFKGCTPPGFEMEREQTHGMRTGSLAGAILDNGNKSDDALLAGMVHDIGKLVLLVLRCDEFTDLIEKSRSEERYLDKVEREAWGVTHAEVGGYLLGLWGLPYSAVEAVALHHEPDLVSPDRFDVPMAVWLANVLIDEQDGRESRVDEELLDRLGVLDRLDEWRSLAAGQEEVVL